MSLQVKIQVSRGDDLPDLTYRWVTRDYEQIMDQLLTVGTSLTIVQHGLDSIAFMYIVKATTPDTAEISMFQDQVSEPFVFDDIFTAIGTRVETLRLQASAETSLRIYLAG
ncbi:MAG: hypothetical protein ACYSYL_00260 [Planctomycetota bacterium]|jgi:hypothetical protein